MSNTLPTVEEIVAYNRERVATVQPVLSPDELIARIERILFGSLNGEG